MHEIGLEEYKIDEETSKLTGKTALKAFELESDRLNTWYKKIHTINPVEAAYQEVYFYELHLLHKVFESHLF